MGIVSGTSQWYKSVAQVNRISGWRKSKAQVDTTSHPLLFLAIVSFVFCSCSFPTLPRTFVGIPFEENGLSEHFHEI